MKKESPSGIFNQFFENSIDLLCVADKQGIFRKVNPEWKNVFGYNITELEGKRFIEFVHPEDINITNEATAKLASNNRIQNFTNRCRHKNGTYRWIEWRSFQVEGVIYASARDITERKEIERALKEREEMFRVAFNNAPTGMSIIAPDGQHYFEVNPLLCEMLGYTREEFLNGTISNVTHPDDDARSREWIRKKINNEPCEPDFEKRYIHKDGHIVWGSVRSQWIRNPDNSLRMAIAHIADITKHKMAEEALRQSEKQYRLLFENMTSGFALHQMIYDKDGKPCDYRYIEANPAFEKLTGLVGMQGKTIKEILPNIEDHWIQTFGKVAMTGEPISYMNYAKDLGRYYDTYVFCPEKDKFAVVFNDATQRVNAEKELRMSEEKFSIAFLTSPDAISISRISDDVYVEINEGFSTITGYLPEDVIGKTSLELNVWVNLDDRERLAQEFKDKNKINNFEAQFRRKDGVILTGLMSAAIISLQGEQYFLSITRDITERKTIEQEIRNLNIDLERRVEQRTEKLNEAIKDLESFAHSISHDLRAPIRHIEGFVRLLSQAISQPTHTTAGYIGKIDLAIGRMSTMIDNLLTFSRLGRKELLLSAVDIESLVHEIIDQLKPDTGKRRIKWKILYLPEIMCDRDLLKLAFENLISNAIKYTSKKREAIIEIGSTSKSETLYEIYIKDNGVGFNMAYAGKLFGVFQRLHTNEEFEGIGIGLANVKQIIQKHKGTIRAEGNINKGAIFYIILPK